jgi:hypothetical protein
MVVCGSVAWKGGYERWELDVLAIRSEGEKMGPEFRGRFHDCGEVSC